MKLGAAHQCDRDRSLKRIDPLMVPGYRLVERLQGEGEVWSAEGPGGLRASLRIIRPARGRNLDALQRAMVGRSPRHPNLQASFGSWRVGTLLILATELPDASLWDRFGESVSAGLAGVPRLELIAAVAEAARALDYLNGLTSTADRNGHPGRERRNCPHGDVSPRTLLFIGGGLKVADINPERWLPPGDVGAAMTQYPDYAAPERLQGRTSPHSDQFSLASTYAYVLSGRYTTAANLAAFCDVDRRALARALVDDPDLRWPSCGAFVQALGASAPVSTPPPTLRDLPSAAAGRAFEDAPEPRSFLGVSSVLALAAATGVVTLAGTLWARHPGPTPRGRTARHSPDRRASTPSAVPAGWLADGATATPRPRLQNPTDGPITQPSASAAIPFESDPTPTPTPSSTPAVIAPRPGASATLTPPTSGPKVAGPPLVSPPFPPDLLARSLMIDSQPAALLLDVRPNPLISARRAGEEAFQNGRYEDARAAYSEAIRLSPDDHRSYHGRALAAYHRREWKDALADLDASIRIQPGVSSTLNDRALTLLALGERPRAFMDFDDAIRLDPQAAVVRYNRGNALIQIGTLDRALADFDEAIRLSPRFAKAYRCRAVILSRIGDIDRAQADYETALRLSPSDVIARNNLGLLHVAKGALHRAAAEFDEAIRIDPAYPMARYNRGRVYCSLGNLREALACFDQAIRLEPGMNHAIEARAQLLAQRADLVATRPSLGFARPAR